jgi:hypothetical protein
MPTDPRLEAALASLDAYSGRGWTAAVHGTARRPAARRGGALAAGAEPDLAMLGQDRDSWIASRSSAARSPAVVPAVEGWRAATRHGRCPPPPRFASAPLCSSP